MFFIGTLAVQTVIKDDITIIIQILYHYEKKNHSFALHGRGSLHVSIVFHCL